MLVKIDTRGKLEFIWNDALAPLLEIGVGTIKRASHVEPTPEGKWEADLSPVSGPLLGPYDTRGEALGAEVAWLETNHLGVPDDH